MNVIRAWYREPLVWMIIAIPLSAVVVGMIMLSIAIRTHDGLVVDDYYKKGKEINMSLARDRAAAQHGLRASVTLDATREHVIVQLTTTTVHSLPDKVDLRWLHATRAGFDHSQILIRAADGRYRGAFPELAPGRWYVQIEAQDWRLQASFHIPGEVRLELVPVPGVAPPTR